MGENSDVEFGYSGKEQIPSYSAKDPIPSSKEQIPEYIPTPEEKRYYQGGWDFGEVTGFSNGEGVVYSSGGHYFIRDEHKGWAHYEASANTAGAEVGDLFLNDDPVTKEARDRIAFSSDERVDLGYSYQIDEKNRVIALGSLQPMGDDDGKGNEFGGQNFKGRPEAQVKSSIGVQYERTQDWQGDRGHHDLEVRGGIRVSDVDERNAKRDVRGSETTIGGELMAQHRYVRDDKTLATNLYGTVGLDSGGNSDLKGGAAVAWTGKDKSDEGKKPNLYRAGVDIDRTEIAGQTGTFGVANLLVIPESGDKKISGSFNVALGYLDNVERGDSGTSNTLAAFVGRFRKEGDVKPNVDGEWAHKLFGEGSTKQVNWLLDADAFAQGDSFHEFENGGQYIAPQAQLRVGPELVVRGADGKEKLTAYAKAGGAYIFSHEDRNGNKQGGGLEASLTLGLHAPWGDVAPDLATRAKMDAISSEQQRAESYSRTILNTAKNGGVLTSADGQTVYHNGEPVRMSGKELVGTFAKMDPEGAWRVREVMPKVQERMGYPSMNAKQHSYFDSAYGTIISTDSTASLAKYAPDSIGGSSRTAVANVPVESGMQAATYQAALKNRGYTLGTTGELGDGVDGNWGKTSAAALRTDLSKLRTEFDAVGDNKGLYESNRDEYNKNFDAHINAVYKESAGAYATAYATQQAATKEQVIADVNANGKAVEFKPSLNWTSADAVAERVKGNPEQVFALHTYISKDGVVGVKDFRANELDKEAYGQFIAGKTPEQINQLFTDTDLKSKGTF